MKSEFSSVSCAGSRIENYSHTKDQSALCFILTIPGFPPSPQQTFSDIFGEKLSFRNILYNFFHFLGVYLIPNTASQVQYIHDTLGHPGSFPKLCHV